MDVSASAHNNNGINFLLCVIDIWSRYAWVVPLKNKEGRTCTEAFRQLIAERKPEILMSDNGSEFINRGFVKLLKDHKITPSYAEPGDHHRMGIVERFNKTLRGKMVKYMTANKTKTYIDVLPKLVKNYNTSGHSSLGGSTPSNPNESKIKQRLEQREFRASQDTTVFAVGDSVRSLKNKLMFEKGAMPKWSQTVHKIINRVGGKRYTLDNDKTYLYYQLKLIPKNSESAPQKPSTDTHPSEQKNPNEKNSEGIFSPKKQRLALKKEGVETQNIQTRLRERKPAVALTTHRGEKINW